MAQEVWCDTNGVLRRFVSNAPVFTRNVRGENAMLLEGAQHMRRG